MSTPGRRVAVFGGARGIGGGISRRLAAAGCDVAIVHKQLGDEAEKTFAAARAHGHRVVPIQLDLAQPGAGSAAVREAVSALGGLDGVVSAAAAPLRLAWVHRAPLEDFAAQWQLAVSANVEIAHGALPALRAGTDPAVVFVLSSVTLESAPGQWGAYTTAKYGALGLMRTLATEWARFGIRVNAVSPSFTATDFVSALPPQLGPMLAEKNPLKRLATPEDTAAAVAYLLSPAASFVTGVNLAVNGGG